MSETGKHSVALASDADNQLQQRAAMTRKRSPAHKVEHSSRRPRDRRFEARERFSSSDVVKMKHALVIPFPQAQRRRFILRMAARVTGVSAKTGEKLLIAMERQQAVIMTRKGIPLDVVQRECRNLESAIRAEIWRRVLLPDDVA